MDLFIDAFTPCLEDAKTGEILPTTFSIASKNELKQLEGWSFDWTHEDLAGAEIYKLCIAGSSVIEGLIAITEVPENKAVYVNIAENAPHNRGESKRYKGAGGHLFAIAALQSVKKGYGGYMYMDAKNMKLVEHYSQMLGAVYMGRVDMAYRMRINEAMAKRILDEYAFEEG